MKFLRWVALVAVCACVASAQQPTVNPGGVLNAASYNTANPPGSLIVVFGTNFASKVLVASSTPLSMQIGSGTDKVSVSIANKPAPIYYIAQNQLSVQLPWGVAPGNANIVVTRNGTASPSQTMTVATFSPGIFTINQAGSGAAWVINNNDGSVAQPVAGWPFPKIVARSAKAGDNLFVYATGLGPVASPPNDGAAPCPAPPACPANYAKSAATTTAPEVLINGTAIPAANVQFSALTPFYPGVYQLNFKMPSGIPASDTTTLEVRIGGVTSNKVTFATQ
jgi:uncharacterized protein (TIGR03437 family)